MIINPALEDLKQEVKSHYVLTVGEEIWYRVIGEKVDILRRIKEELPNTTEETFRKSVFDSLFEDCENEGQILLNIAVYETAFDVYNMFEL